MHSKLFIVAGPWAGRLAVMPRPRGQDWLEDEVLGWKQAGIATIISLLTEDEVAELGLEEEEKLCGKHNLDFVSFPIPDRQVPASREEFSKLIGSIVERLTAGQGVAVHCRQGIGRSALVAIGVLLRFQVDLKQAVEGVTAARGCVVPETPEQTNWIVGFAA